MKLGVGGRWGGGQEWVGDGLNYMTGYILLEEIQYV